MREQLRARKVKMTSAQELLFAKEKGVPIIDIRPPDEFDAAHIPGSINIPLYRPITGWGTRSVLRRAGFAFFGIFNGTELNPDFFLDIVAAVSKDLGAVLLCNIGGKLDVTDTNPAGTQSRSLIAAYEITKLDITNGAIGVLKGGFGEWQRTGRPVERPAGK
ncbi:g2172 [Coccomyxa viridis]|uniref:G2172 protein n=1 Tax=Coccomyxa viridis TaxID=1274662 RepID=A0ABP1FLY5_9CHLO